MLRQLHIRDFALVESLDLEFGSGMSVISGETGAGTSILIDAIGLLLGDRADANVVRYGAERADLSAVFEVRELPKVHAWLSANQLERGGECILRRVINNQGRSRAYINGVPQPLQNLRELGEQLLDIHGQHAHQTLLQRELQRDLFDTHTGSSSLRQQVRESFSHWQALDQQLQRLAQADAQRDARLDLVRYQIGELERLGLQPGEWEQIEQEHTLLAHAGERLNHTQQVLQQLYEQEEHSADALLGQGLDQLEELLSLDPNLAPIYELLQSAAITLREGCQELRRYSRQIELDPERLAWLEQRLADVQTLARKYRVAAEQLPQRLQALQRELSELDASDDRVAELQQQRAQAWQSYQQLAQQLSAARQQQAEPFAHAVSAVIQRLGMPGGRLALQLTPLAQPGRYGLEQIEFWVSANPGQPLRPLHKVASGGELARISLAIQVIAADANPLPTLIFDEVDTGIGGAVAEVVGQQLRKLAHSRQVLCVTHLPQVAAQAHQHLQVQKVQRADNTYSTVHLLNPTARLQELARMLGGVELTEATLQHAREMLSRAQG